MAGPDPQPGATSSTPTGTPVTVRPMNREHRELLASDDWREVLETLAFPFAALHVDDVYCPVDPATLPARLAAAGVVDIEVRDNGFAWAGHARRPG